MSMLNTKVQCGLAAILLLAGTPAWPQSAVYQDDFTGTHNQLDWVPLDYACLTAGDGSGTIPACASPNETPGHGALRLTPPVNYMTGAILSDFTFPLSQGLQVTFTTYTYGENGSHNSFETGADGMSFFLTDGSKPLPAFTGGSGGALGYSCSNTNTRSASNGFLHVQGVSWGYLGLGIDEFGNFLNSGDTTSTGIYNSNSSSGTTAHGTNSYKRNVWGGIAGGSGPQFQPQRIGLRGAGNVTWEWLHQENPDYYTAATWTSGGSQAVKIREVCASGKYVSSGSNAYNNLKPLPLGNYHAISDGYYVLPETTPISNVLATQRKDATPISYKLSISATGYLNFAYSYNGGTYQPVLTNKNIVAINGSLPASFRFGFSGGTGGQNNIHELTCFAAKPLQSNSSAAANTQRSGEVKTGSQIFLASYSPNGWWGSLQAVSLVGVGGVLTVSNVANWDARCVLTGGLCPPMGQNASGNTISVPVQSPANRVLLTWNAQGIPLEWNSLGPAQKTDLYDATGSQTEPASKGEERLDWLRGDRSNEQLQSATGTLRAREYVFGDIINSSPTWVGAPDTLYSGADFVDGLYPAAAVPEAAVGAQSYVDFATLNAQRTHVVYVGGNDGFLHGFSAGSNHGNGSFDPALNHGKELIGFMPKGVLENKARELTSPGYSHDYLVDATPATGEVFYANAWHTWLVGGVGSNGKELYALDITDPSAFSISNAASMVIGDWDSSSPDLTHLGNTVGSPSFARMHNGEWAFIFGSGSNGSGTSGVYIGLINSANGDVSFVFLDTTVIGAGINYVTPADLDGDLIADYLYAGDTKGNVWRFDVTSSSPSGWQTSGFGTGSPKPLYVALDAGGNRQPISTKIIWKKVDTRASSGPRYAVMLYFGTGQKIPQTSTTAEYYATGTQTFYGVMDWDMDTWNLLAGSTDIASKNGPLTMDRSNLLQQGVIVQSLDPTSTTAVQGRRTLSTQLVQCLAGTQMCASGSNDMFGWYFDLPDSNEQIIYAPAIISGAVVVNTAVPPVIAQGMCSVNLQTGWTMAFNLLTGGSMPDSYFLNKQGVYDVGGSAGTSGIKLDAVGTPIGLTYLGKSYLATQTSSGNAQVVDHNTYPGPPAGPLPEPGRVSWQEIH